MYSHQSNVGRVQHAAFVPSSQQDGEGQGCHVHRPCGWCVHACLGGKDARPQWIDRHVLQLPVPAHHLLPAHKRFPAAGPGHHSIDDQYDLQDDQDDYQDIIASDGDNEFDLPPNWEGMNEHYHRYNLEVEGDRRRCLAHLQAWLNNHSPNHEGAGIARMHVEHLSEHLPLDD